MDKVEQLQEFIKERQSEPFQWGSNDCALFMCDWVKTRTDEDKASEFRGRYKTAMGSLRALKKLGYTGLRDAVTRLYGEPLEHVQLAQRGDVALVSTGLDDAFEGVACGIVTVSGVAVLSEEGLTEIPRSTLVTAWRVK